VINAARVSIGAQMSSLAGDGPYSPFGGFVEWGRLSAGALGDLYGMRRMYQVGMGGATVFSVLATGAGSAP
jgi:hypothetical protein